MGTAEKLGVNIHVDQLMDTIASNCGNLERLELRWDPDNLRFSDKSQKAIDILRVKCLKLRCMVLRWVRHSFYFSISTSILNFIPFIATDDTMKRSRRISNVPIALLWCVPQPAVASLLIISCATITIWSSTSVLCKLLHP